MKRFVFAALAVAGAVFFVVYVKNEKNTQILELREPGSGRIFPGKIYHRWHLEEGAEFAIEFVHSVNQSPVRETFAVEGGMIRLKTLRFYSFGAGIPSDLEAGQQLSQDGDTLLITGYNRSFRELNLILGSTSDHLLLLNGDVYSLRELSNVNPGGENAHVIIRLR